MDIPVNAEVVCTDGLCGHSSCVIISLAPRRVTHVVVREKGFPYMARLVPIELVREGTSRRIHLGCTKNQLATLGPFLEIEYPENDASYFAYEIDEYRTWPYAIAESMPVPVEQEQVPPDGLAVHQGALVKAADGRVGRVNEFLVNSANGHITHLVLREGHLWGKKDVTIPSSEIKRIEEDTVYLKLDKRSVEALPAMPVRGR